ncbi:MAG: preprotein translocase subunit SecE [Chloroflexota bacterium]
MARTPRRRASTMPKASPAAGGGEPRRPRSPAVAPSGGGIARPAPIEKKGRRFGFLSALQPRFAADIVSELRKVTWPTLGETRYLTVVVAIVAVAVGLLLGSVDLVFGWAVEKVFFD